MNYVRPSKPDPDFFMNTCWWPPQWLSGKKQRKSLGRWWWACQNTSFLINQQWPWTQGNTSTVTFRVGLSLPLWFHNNKPILLYSVIEPLFNAGPANNINLVPVQLCTVWGGAGRRRRRWTQTVPIPCGLHSSQPAGVIGALLTWTAKVIAQ